MNKDGQKLNRAIQKTAYVCRCAGCRRLFASASAATVFCYRCWEMQIADQQPRSLPDIGGSSVPTDTRIVYVLAGRLEGAAAEAAAEAATEEASKPQTVAQALEAEALKARPGFMERVVRGLGGLGWLLAMVLAFGGVVAFSFILSAGAAYLQGWDQ